MTRHGGAHGGAHCKSSLLLKLNFLSKKQYFCISTPRYIKTDWSGFASQSVLWRLEHKVKLRPPSGDNLCSNKDFQAKALRYKRFPKSILRTIPVLNSEECLVKEYLLVSDIFVMKRDFKQTTAL